MNLNKLVSSAYSWFSLDKVLWFMAFFWISLPFIVTLPQLFAAGSIYSEVTLPIAVILYDVLYVIFFVGIILLIKHCLAQKKEPSAQVSLRKIVDLVFLVFLEMFYVFVWNISAKFRKVQLLLIIASALFWYLFISSLNPLILILFSWCLLGYFTLVIKNAVMLFFSTTIFLNKDVSIKGAIKESYSLVHNRVADTFSAIIISLFLAFIIFAVITIVLGTVYSMILTIFFIEKIAFSIGFKVAFAFGLGPALIAYHFMMVDVYSQLSNHKSAATSIKRILSNRVLSPKSHKQVAVRRPLRKSVKKKSRK